MTVREQDQEYILPLYNRLKPEIVRGEGMWLYDREGRKYLDFYSGIAVNNLGQRHPRVVSAIEEQLGSYLHLSNYFVSSPVAGLAQKLVETSFAKKVYFANSGSEANEAMIKLARKYGRDRSPEKYRLVAAEGAFHGRTSGALTLTGRSAYSDPFGPLLPGVIHVPVDDLTRLEQAVDENTCGIFLELIQGEGGIRPLSREYVEKVRELAERYDALILVDEIQSGLMRTGSLYAHELYDLVPDAMTLAKSLGGGLPLGALLVGEKAAEVLGRGDHGSTFGGNPVACAAGKAVLDTITEEGFQERVGEMSRLLRNGLEELQTRYPEYITEIRGYGLMLGVEVGSRAAAIRDLALKKGLLLNVTSGTVLRLLPALIIGPEEIDFFLKTLEETFQEV